MGLLRGVPPCARAMARLGAVRSHYCALLLAAALAVCAFYYLGSGRETFSSATKRLKEARAGAPAVPSPPVLEVARGSVAPALGAKAKSLESGGAGPVDYHLLMMFTKAEHNAALQAKARIALRSLLRLAKFEANEVLNLHFVSEEASREVAKALLRELLPPAAGFKCKVSRGLSWRLRAGGSVSARAPPGSGGREGGDFAALPTVNANSHPLPEVDWRHRRGRVRVGASALADYPDLVSPFNCGPLENRHAPSLLALQGSLVSAFTVCPSF